MPATIDEAFSDPYKINKKIYDGFSRNDTGVSSNKTVPSQTSSFIRNPEYVNVTPTQVNFGKDTISIDKNTQSIKSMPVPLPISPKNKKKSKKHKTKKSQKRKQRGGGNITLNSYQLLIINIIFGLIILFSLL